jgi:hypothetical protein
MCSVASAVLVLGALQAGDMRTSIGSGLLQLGLQPKMAVGLYSINCKGALHVSRHANRRWTLRCRGTAGAL